MLIKGRATAAGLGRQLRLLLALLGTAPLWVRLSQLLPTQSVTPTDSKTVGSKIFHPDPDIGVRRLRPGKKRRC